MHFVFIYALHGSATILALGLRSIIWCNRTFDDENINLSVCNTVPLNVEPLCIIHTVQWLNASNGLLGFCVKSDSYLWLDWSWWITWGAACGNVSVERSWEHGQQSRSLRQSTQSSVVNLNVRSLIWRQKGFFFLRRSYPTLFPTPPVLCRPYIRPLCIPFPAFLLAERCSAMFSPADMNNGTIASVLREGAPRQFTLIVLKLPGEENHLFCLML